MQKAQPALVSFAACCPRSSNRGWEICTSIMMASTLKGPISPKKSKDPPSQKITLGSFFRLFYHPYQEYWADPRNMKMQIASACFRLSIFPAQRYDSSWTAEIVFTCIISIELPFTWEKDI